MNILFLTLAEISDVNQGGIYPDLMKCFIEKGHQVTIISPIERRHGIIPEKKKGNGFEIIRVKTLNIQKTNFVEKTLGTLLIDNQFRKTVKNNNLISVDLLIYSTPPITLVNTISYVKKKYKSFSYLLLKDIFPQNAVDLSMITKGGLPYKYFRMKEKILYKISDAIGCMSPANVDYLRKYNPDIDSDKIEVCPNSIIPQKKVISNVEKRKIRLKYNLPENKRIFVYGGNLGRPQGVDFIIAFLDTQLSNDKAFYIIAGSGTEYNKLKTWIDSKEPKNVLLFPYLPKNEYDSYLKCGDVGLIFLDNRFTIPNYPSRLLPYIDNGMPVIAAVDKNTDIGITLENNRIGKSSLSGDINTLKKNIDYFCLLDDEEYNNYSLRARAYLLENDTVNHATDIILNAARKKSL